MTSVTTTNDAIHLTPPAFVSFHGELRFELSCVYSTIRLMEYKNCMNHLPAASSPEAIKLAAPVRTSSDASNATPPHEGAAEH